MQRTDVMAAFKTGALNVDRQGSCFPVLVQGFAVDFGGSGERRHGQVRVDLERIADGLRDNFRCLVHWSPRS
jgi:hypothetical protein